MEQNITSAKKTITTSSFDAFSFLLILSLGFILPIFFIPFFSLSVSISKTVLVAIFTTVAFFLWLISRLKDGRLIFPKSSILGAGIVVVLSFLFSSIFSKAPIISFVGLVGEVGTFSSILLFYILMFLSSIYFQDKKRIFYFYSAVLVSSLSVFLYQLFLLVSLYFGWSLSGLLNVLPQVIIGGWTDTAVFFGFTAILLLLTLETTEVTKKVRTILRAMLAISLIVLFLINMRLSWIIVGSFSLIIFVYSISFGKNWQVEHGKRKIPTQSLVVLIISLFFVFAGSTLSNSIYSFFNIPQDIFRPTFGQTLDIMKGTLSEDPILGAGPNRFVNQWLLLKPDEVNASGAWNLDFNKGVGLIPSFMVTTGIVGILAWIYFFVAFIYSGIRFMFLTHVEKSHRYITLSSFVLALYLWLFSIFYIPEIMIIFLTFTMTGIFVASLSRANVIKNYDFSYLNDPRIGFVSVLVLITFVMSSVVGGYLLSQRFLSIGYFQKSISAFNTKGSAEDSEKNILKAIRFNKNDLYYRTRAEIDLARINAILSQSEAPDKALQTRLFALSQSAINYSIIATETDETNYLNWIFLARVYASLIQLGDADRLYNGARQSYLKALSLNPNSPRIPLLQSRLELIVGNKDLAKDYILQSINKKRDYTEAIFLLSQIQADEGDIDNAIITAEAASFAAPNNIGVSFQLGLLRYRKEDYAGAISAFESAISLDSNYSNARYFLGLSYNNQGQREKAIQQFESIKILNPENVEVEKILSNLKAGRQALSDIQSPVDSEELPVGDE